MAERLISDPKASTEVLAEAINSKLIKPEELSVIRGEIVNTRELMSQENVIRRSLGHRHISGHDVFMEGLRSYHGKDPLLEEYVIS